MEGNRYNASEDKMGNITLVDNITKKSVYFQGDDADIFREKWETISAIWAVEEEDTKRFASYEEHFDAIADDYFEVMS